MYLLYPATPSPFCSHRTQTQQQTPPTTIMRTMNRLTSSSQAPPPSPIPTGRGSRSAADPIFSEHLSQSLKIPDLSLPEYVHRSVPADIDRHSLSSREGNSAKRLLRSAAEFGAFRISRHGIAVEELRSALAEADSIFRIPDDRKGKYCLDYGGYEGFVWRRFTEAVAERAGIVIGAEKFRHLSHKMETVENSLEAIAGELAIVISENANKQLIQKEIRPAESILSLYRCVNGALTGDSPPLSYEGHRKSCYGHALSLHLLLDKCEFHVQSERGSLSFNAIPDTIIVTVGNQLEEWSLGEFKSAYGEVIFEPNLSSSGASFSIELNCSPSTFKQDLGKINKTIRVADQILFLIITALLYNFLVFMFQ